MKKLLTIALLTLSPFTFAKDFNPDLLIGKWQCKAKFDMLQSSLIGIEKSTTIFYRNGRYDSTSEMKEKVDGQDFSQKMLFNGQWKINSNILSSNVETVIDYTSDNPQIESAYEFGKSYREDKTFTDFKILKLTKNTLIHELPQKDQIELDGNSIENCHRIK